MQVRHAATMHLECVGPNEPVDLVAEKMRSTHVGFIPVVNSSGQALGVVTDRDLALRVVGEDLDPRTTQALDIMSDLVHSVYEDDDLDRAIELMSNANVRRLLVKDCEGRAVGVLSIDDLAMLSVQGDAAGLVLHRIVEHTAPAGASEEWPSFLS